MVVEEEPEDLQVPNEGLPYQDNPEGVRYRERVARTYFS